MYKQDKGSSSQIRPEGSRTQSFNITHSKTIPSPSQPASARHANGEVLVVVVVVVVVIVIIIIIKDRVLRICKFCSPG